jgi:hypothetical protein
LEVGVWCSLKINKHKHKKIIHSRGFEG